MTSSQLTGARARRAIWAATLILVVHLFFLGVQALYPAESVFYGQGFANVAYFIYIIFVVFVALFSWPFFAPRHRFSGRIRITSYGFVSGMVYLALAISSASLLALAYDLIFIQGIDYSLGLASARSQWRALAQDRVHVSSVFSAIGNFGGRFFFLALALLVLHWERFSLPARLGSLALIVAELGAISILTASRTNILLAIAIAVACGIVRALVGRSVVPGSKGFQLGLIAIVLVASNVYAAWIFSLRTDANLVSAERYSTSLVTRLGGYPTDNFFPPNMANFPPEMRYYLLANGVYLAHTLWTFGNVIEDQDRPGAMLFGSFWTLARRLGLVYSLNEPHLVSGRWVPLSGAIWYDYELSGFITIGALHGILLGLAFGLVSSGRGGGLGFGFAMTILVGTVLAPLIAATEMVGVTYFLVSFIPMSGLATLFWKRQNWFPSATR